jgi:hypothetical protein
MTFPTFSSGEVLTAADMNAVGLWLVKSQTVGTGVSSVTVTGAFSADYDNYKVIYTNGAGSTLADLRVTIGGISSNVYFGSMFGTALTTSAFIGLGFLSQTSWLYCGFATTGYTMLDATIYSPFISGKNKMISCAWTYNNSGGGYSMFNGEIANTSSMTSLTITPSAGTLTGGTIAVYGYKK